MDTPRRPRPAPPPERAHDDVPAPATGGPPSAPAGESGLAAAGGRDDQAPGTPQHRRIRDLLAGTFRLAAQRWRDFAVVAIVSAAFAVVMFWLLEIGVDVLASAVFELPSYERFTELAEQQDATPDELWAALREWLGDIERGDVASALLLMGASFGVALIGAATSTAAMLIALDEFDTRRLSASEALVTGFARVPKFLALVSALAMLLGASVLLCVALFYVHAALAVVAIVVLFVLCAVYGPLVQMYGVALVVEPGFCSPGRWWSLMRGRKAATWGRLVLCPMLAVGVLMLMELATGAGENVYAQLTVDVLVGTVVWMLLDVAFALMYADLSGRSRPVAGQQPGLGN